MIGAIAGDIIGSIYEHNNIKTTKFNLFSEGSRFTDDTVLTVATMDCLLNNKDYARTYKEYCHKYPNAGYGMRFIKWSFSSNLDPYNSWGNGSAMRVSPVAYAFDTLDDVLLNAKKSAQVTHNHPEGIKGAQAAAAAIFLAKKDKTKSEIKEYIIDTFGYDLSSSVDSLRCWYDFDVSCQGTLPPAMIVFLESENFENAVRKAISIGGDSDTIACIVGGIAEAFYNDIPEVIEKEVFRLLDNSLATIVKDFYNKYYKI